MAALTSVTKSRPGSEPYLIVQLEMWFRCERFRICLPGRCGPANGWAEIAVIEPFNVQPIASGIVPKCDFFSLRPVCWVQCV
jgi:hypothetical protein